MSEAARYFDAIRNGDVIALRDLVATNPGLLATTTEISRSRCAVIGLTGLHVAIDAEQTDAGLALIEAGIGLEQRSSEGRTALHDSIEYGANAITTRLIEAGAEVDICSAAILGDVARVRELLERDPRSARDMSTGLSPLGWAAYGNRVDTAIELLGRGADAGDFALLCAASTGHVQVGRLLIQRGADPNAIDPESGFNAVHAATNMMYTDNGTPFLEMLADEGADLSLASASGLTALEILEWARNKHESERARGTARGTKNFEAVSAFLRKSLGSPIDEAVD